jgi:hypothetical protein
MMFIIKMICSASSSRNNDVAYEYDNVRSEHCTPNQQGCDIVPMVGCFPNAKSCQLESNYHTKFFLHLDIINNYQLFH